MKHKTIIIYHANCPDGFSAAWAAWKKFGKYAIYIAQEHHTPPPTPIEGADLYLLDFCFPKEIIEDIKRKVRILTIIDHHITAQAIVESVSRHSFDNSHSGAVLTWKYFHKQPIPKLLRYVEDIDLWLWKLKNTAEINSTISLSKMDFKTWTKMARDLETTTGRKNIVMQGRTVLHFKERLLSEMAEGAEEVDFEGYRTLLAVSPTIIHSELGNVLVKKLPPIGIVYRRKGSILKISLRSDGSVDVSKIAQKYGGGGHKAAAGFQVNINEPHPWKKLG